MNEVRAQKIIEKTRDDYNRIAEHFASTRNTQWPIVQKLLQQYCHEGDNVLDVGCGNGRVAKITNKIKTHYTGIDISARLIAIARQQHPHATFVTGMMTQLPFPDGYVDVVLVLASFHHLPSRSLRGQTLRECARVLKPNGIIIMLNWNIWQPQFWWKHVWHFLQHPSDVGDLTIPWKDPQGNILAQRFYHGITQRAMRRLANQTALQMIEQYYEQNGRPTSWWCGNNLVTVLEAQYKLW